MRLLTKEYPNAAAVSTEIINLRAICCLPKGTEYFFSDPHGEAEAFGYLLNTASGVIRDKIEGLFARSVPLAQREELSLLITQPDTVLAGRRETPDFDDWCRISIYQLVQVCRQLASKYTRSKVRKMMPARFSYILDELLHADTEENKEEYYAAIIDFIVGTGIAEGFITELCAPDPPLRGRPAAHHRGHLRPRPPRRPDHRAADDLPPRRRPVGQPRHPLAGRLSGQPGLRRQRGAAGDQLQQLRSAGGRLRHQPAGAVDVRR